MPRDNAARSNARHAKAKRATALARIELGQPSTSRTAAAGPTSMAVKTCDPALRAIIDAAVAKRDCGDKSS